MKNWMELLLFLTVLGITLCFPLPRPNVSLDILMPPSAAHWLGTTALGEDMLHLLASGATTTVAVGLAAGLLTTGTGMVVGFVSQVGTQSVRTATFLVSDILLAIPEIALLLLLTTFLRPGPLVLVALLAFTGWPGEVRIFASAIQSELTRDSVEAARLFGGSGRYIFTRHIIPPVFPLLVARTVAGTRRATLKHASLAFLGFVSPITPSWGGIMQNAFNYLHTPAWTWLILPPVICLSAYLLLLLAAGERLVSRPRFLEVGHPADAHEL
jgi:peptide/nickel transport system permease protein